MQEMTWDQLNHLQLGKYAEYYTKLRLTRHGLQIYSPEIDDRGIDFIARPGDGPFIEIQVKSIRGFNYVFMRKEHFPLGQTRYLVLGLFVADSSDEPDLFLIPATTWLQPDAVFVSRDYEDSKSAPEWGINVSRKNLPRLRDFAFDKMLAELA
ncbi:MAG: DUF4365 domain-containing protein [Pseudomonadota bacterium]